MVIFPAVFYTKRSKIGFPDITRKIEAMEKLRKA